MTNQYEMLKNAFIAMVTDRVADLTVDQMNRITECLDVCAAHYTVEQAETALSVPSEDVPELVRTYIATKTIEGLSKLGLKNRLWRLRIFCRYVQKPFDQVTTQDIRVFLYKYQEDRGISGSSLENVRGDICTFFHWLAAEGYIQRDPAITIKPIKYEKKQRQSLSQIELEYVRKCCKDIRERAMIEFMYSTGCRVSELIGVKLQDVNFQTDEVHLFGKGQKHRTSYINAKCHVALQEYLKTRNDNSEYLFVHKKRPHDQLTRAQIEKIVNQIKKRTGLTKPISPHILRHTTATQAVQHGMPVEEVKVLLGHENIATTMIYVETSQDEVKTGHAKAVI